MRNVEDWPFWHVHMQYVLVLLLAKVVLASTQCISARTCDVAVSQSSTLQCPISKVFKYTFALQISGCHQTGRGNPSITCAPQGSVGAHLSQ